MGRIADADFAGLDDFPVDAAKIHVAGSGGLDEADGVLAEAVIGSSISADNLKFLLYTIDFLDLTPAPCSSLIGEGAGPFCGGDVAGFVPARDLGPI